MHIYISPTKMFMLLVAICIAVSEVSGQTLNITSNAVETTASVAEVTSSTSKPPNNESCSLHNNDCNACVENAQCYFCETDNKCNTHIQNVIADGACDIKNAYFKTCKVNFKYMMIAVAVMIGIALLVISIFCCYCCCKRRGVKLSKDDLKWARQKEERKQIAAEKRKERAERTEEIRRKYGLVKDSNPYQRFDA